MPSGEFDFLDAKHEIFVAQEAAWIRDERRLLGGDYVLSYGQKGRDSELARFTNESDAHYAQRLAEAAPPTWPYQHCAMIAGHLRRNAPAPNWGTLGEMRAREDIDTPTLAELIGYNQDGIGGDGSQYAAWDDAAQIRVLGIGHEWTLMEMPSLEDVRRRGRISLRRDEPPTMADVLAGFRPYTVALGARQVPYWEIDRGRLDWAVARVPVGDGRVVNGVWTPRSATLGYYLFVREGYDGVGGRFAAGGWWLFDGEKALQREGTWRDTKGEVPLWPFIGEAATGTLERPAMSKSAAMELGQLAVGLMNRRSERNYDAADAARSQTYILGADPKNPAAFNLTVEMKEGGADLIAVPGYEGPDGRIVIPQVWNSSAGAIPAEVYEKLIASTVEEAREIIIRQVTSTPDSSGRSKEAGFAEATSPFLSRVAARRETWENTKIRFAELRAGNPEPRGFVTYPTRYDLAPLVDDIDAMLGSMQIAGTQAPKYKAWLIEKAGAERRAWPDDDAQAKAFRAELESGTVTDADALAGIGDGTAAPDPLAPADTVPPVTGAPEAVPAPVEIASRLDELAASVERLAGIVERLASAPPVAAPAPSYTIAPVVQMAPKPSAVRLTRDAAGNLTGIELPTPGAQNGATPPEDTRA